MTKKLEDLLNLPDSKEIIKKEKAKESPAAVIAEQEQTFRDISEFDKIAAALPTVDGLGQMADIELNEIADKAMAAYDDLMSLGMNVESRYSGSQPFPPPPLQGKRVGSRGREREGGKDSR